MATSYLSPGVYVEEVDRGSKPIEAVGTNTVGFLGESAKGPLNETVLITNWSQFVKTFGDFKDCSEHLAHGIYGFFNNGGSRCFVVNVGAPEGAKVEVKPAAGDKKDEKAPAAPAVGGGGRDGLYIGRDGGPGARTGLKCLDEGTLSRFWGSLNQPVRPAVQAWTAVPILPEKLEEFKRVQTRQLEYKSLTDPRISEIGPSGNPFLSAKRLDLGGGTAPKK